MFLPFKLNSTNTDREKTIKIIYHISQLLSSMHNTYYERVSNQAGQQNNEVENNFSDFNWEGIM